MALYSIYYSPTGGTEKVSDIVVNAINEACNKINITERNVNGRIFDSDDLCVISVPAFGGRIPANAVEKLRLFKGNKTKVVLIAVFGNRAIDDTLIELYDLAVMQGFVPAGCIEAVAEHSLARIYGAGRPSDDDKKELEAFAEQILEKIKNGEAASPVVPGNRPYKESRSSAMSLVVDDTCINCGKCADACPVGAIPSGNVKTVDPDKCFSCMRCVAVCPAKARRNSPALTAAFEERLRERCAGVKPNKLYL